MVKELFAHLLIALALFKGVARAVTIFEESQRAAGEFLFDKFLDHVLLVLDRGVVTILFLVDRDTTVACDIICFCQYFPPSFSYIVDNIVSYSFR